MAETNGVNKSEAIRDYFKANKKAKPQEVVDALAKKGITVTANLVTTVKSTHNKRRRAVRKGIAKSGAGSMRVCPHCGKPLTEKKPPNGGIGVRDVKAALAFLKLAGGIGAAKQALAVAAEIRKIV